MIDFLFALIELFSLSMPITVPELCGEMCTARLVSQGVDLFALKILPGQGRSPRTILGIRKLETLGYSALNAHPSCWGSVYQPIFREDTLNGVEVGQASAHPI